MVGWRWRRRNGGVGLYNIAAELKQTNGYSVRQKVIMLVVITVILSHHNQMDLSYRRRSLNIRRLISWRIRGSWWWWWVWITPLVPSTCIASVLALGTLAIFLIPIASSIWVAFSSLVEAAQGEAAANDGRRVIGSSSSQGGGSKRR